MQVGVDTKPGADYPDAAGTYQDHTQKTVWSKSKSCTPITYAFTDLSILENVLNTLNWFFTPLWLQALDKTRFQNKNALHRSKAHV